MSKTGEILVAGISAIAAALVLLVVAVPVFISFGQIPDTMVVTGQSLPESVKTDLVEAGIVSEGETIHYYYSEDTLSFLNYGNLFTDARVVQYETDPDTSERILYHAEYNEISDIQFEKDKNLWADSIIRVYEDDELSFLLLVSNEENLDDVFFGKLIQTWESGRSGSGGDL